MIIITIICCLLVVCPFIYRLRNLHKIKLNSSDASWNVVMRCYTATLGKSIPDKTLVEANSVINIESLYATNGINLTKLKSTASTLVGLGILGTFLGLSVALMADLNLSDSETTISSVHSLLGGMKTAFFTSVVGMSASIIFGAFMRSYLNRLQSVIAETCRQLDDKNLASAISFLHESKTLIASQNELLEQLGKSIGDSIGERITTAFAVGSQKLESQLINQTALMKQTSDNISLQLEISSQNLKEIFTEQNTVIKGMANSIGSSVKNVVTDELQNSFKELMDAITNKISGELTTSAERLKECTNLLTQSASTFRSSSSVIDDSAQGLNTAANNLGLSAEVIKDYSNDLNNRADLISNSVEKLNQTISEIGDASNQFSAAANNATDNVNGIINALKEIDVEDIHGTINELLNSIDDFVEGLDKMSDIAGKIPDANKVIKEITDATSTYVNTLHESVKALTASYTNSFTKACESINGTIGKLDNTMTSARNNTESSMSRVVAIITKAAENLNKAANDLKSNETQRR